MKQVLFQNIIQSANCFMLDRLIMTVPMSTIENLTT